MSLSDKNSKVFLTITLNPSIDYGFMVRDCELYKKNRITKLWRSIGGKGINTALVLGILGHPVISFLVVGDKERYSFEKVLIDNNVTPRIISINKSTRCNFKVIEISSGKDTEFNEKGFSISPRIYLQIKKEIEKLLPSCGYLVISGSLPPGIKPDIYGELIHKSNQLNIINAIDTSGPELSISIESKPVILRLNKKEIEEYKGVTFENLRELGETAQQICKSGVRWVVVSLGADGALGADGSEIWYASPPKMSVINPIGSGDAMLAGLLSSFSRSLTLPNALLFSTSLATARVISQNIVDLDLKIVNSIKEKTTLRKIR